MLMTDTVPVLAGLAGFAMHLAFSLASFRWARRVAAARGGVFHVLAYLPLVAFAASVLGGLLTSVALNQAFEAVASAPPESRATLLATSIADAMNATAFGLGTAITLHAVSATCSWLGGAKRPGGAVRDAAS